MCTYLLRHSSGTYYFRMSIPLALRPFMDGKREIKHSLGSKDRDVAKAMIPDHTKAALNQLQLARAAFDAGRRPKKSKAQLEREDALLLFQEEQAELASRDVADRESEIEELEPIMDALAAGKQVEASPEDVARAVQLLVIHEREMASIEKSAALTAIIYTPMRRYERLQLK